MCKFDVMHMEWDDLQYFLITGGMLCNISIRGQDDEEICDISTLDIVRETFATWFIWCNH